MRRATVFALLLAAALPAAAQLRLPTLPGAGDTLDRLRTQRLPELAPTVRDTADSTEALTSARRRALQTLLREQRASVEADPAGAPVRRGELLLVAPTPALLRAALAEGFTLLRETVLDGLDLRHSVLAPPRGMALAAALARLRALDPAVEADFHHLYTPGGALGAATETATLPKTPMPAAAPRRVGLVDGGVDAGHPALRGVALQRWGCNGAVPPADGHGTAVASLLGSQAASLPASLPASQAAGRDTTLYAADVYCGAPAGGGVEAVAQALAWLAREQVAVINLSLVGPPNRLLERAVAAVTARGHLVVAAVGNDGPAAPPLYPAAYPGVLGITGVGAARRVLPEAAQGPHVAFAAPGAELSAARPGGGHVTVRGTSFAAALVAGLLAERLPLPDTAARERVLQALALAARDLGAPGRDPVYGHGLVAERPETAAVR